MRFDAPPDLFETQKWESDPSVKVLLMKGAGGKAFCAGGDIVAVAQAAKAGTSLSHDFFREEYVLGMTANRLISLRRSIVFRPRLLARHLSEAVCGHY